MKPSNSGAARIPRPFERGTNLLKVAMGSSELRVLTGNDQQPPGVLFPEIPFRSELLSGDGVAGI